MTAPVALVVVIPHGIGPEGWLAGARSLAEALERYPQLRLTLRLPGAALDHLARHERRLVERLASAVDWLAGGYSDPVLAEWPPAVQVAQLEREHKAMEALGITPSGLWVGSSWDPGYATLARQWGLSLVAVSADLLPHPPHHGVFDRAGDTVVVLAVGEVGTVFADGTLPVAQVDPSEVGRWAGAPTVCLNVPGRLPLVAPRRTTRDNRVDPFYRRLLLTPGPADELLALQSRELSDPEVNHPWGRLLVAQAQVESSRHRGEGWAEVRDIDWDADGLDEVWVETPTVSMMIDPNDGALDWWADKSRRWPVTEVTPPVRGQLLRVMSDTGDVIDPVPLRLEGQSDVRSQVSLTLSDEVGNGVRLRVETGALGLEVTVAAAASPRRIGPEIAVAIDNARLRVDGGEWVAIDQPRAAGGHRFRFEGSGRALLVSSPRPTELFARPQGEGLVVWAHWLTTGGTYLLEISLGESTPPAA